MTEQQKPWWGHENLPPPEKITRPKKKSKPFLAVALFSAIVVSMVGFVAFTPDPMEPKASEFNSTLHPANALQTIGKCGGIFEFDVPKEYSGEIPEDFFDNPYGGSPIKRTIPKMPTIVPAYGYFLNMSEDKPSKKFWDAETEVEDLPTRPEYLNYMWHGWTIVWYTPDSDDQVTNSIKSYANAHDQVVAIPWHYDRGLPFERKVALSSWGVTSTCGLWSSDIANEFIKFSQEKNANRDESKPYPAMIQKDGELPTIDIPQFE